MAPLFFWVDIREPLCGVALAGTMRLAQNLLCIYGCLSNTISQTFTRFVQAINEVFR